MHRGGSGCGPRRTRKEQQRHNNQVARNLSEEERTLLSVACQHYGALFRHFGYPLPSYWRP
eukprot:5007756-Prorocentrum_lima.AAC.1